MAFSRLEKVGTIFSRVRGLLKSGALKEEDKPIWYNIYEAFPPMYEPRYDRPAPDVPIKKIFYPEDTVRAKFHKEFKSVQAVNLLDQHLNTDAQKLISIYEKLKSEGKLCEEDLYAAALDILKTERTVQRERKKIAVEEDENSSKSSLVSSFKEAQKDKAKSSLDIKDIFKE